MSLLTETVSLPVSSFPPLALGFMGLGTGYLIYGTQELFGYPTRSSSVDLASGVWGVWMPGFLQFLAGTYLFAGLTLFGTFKARPLYMAALAFTAFGVHWFALGWNRLKGGDSRVSLGMTVAFCLISVLGVIVFFGSHDDPVGGVFIGLVCVYVAEFVASLRPDFTKVGVAAGRVLGFFRLGTGFWLIYLMFAVTLNFVLRYNLPA